MQQQERGRKQATSGSRAGANFFVEEANNIGMKLMASMGWKEGQGLGKNEDGLKQYLKAKYKNDSTGIGATTTTVDVRWTEAQTKYNGVLQRLKDGNTPSPSDDGDSPTPSPTPSPSPEAEAAAAATSAQTEANLKQHIAKRAMYSRFKRAKDTSNYSATAMAEIFGRKPDAPSTSSTSSTKSESSSSVKSEPSSSSSSSVAAAEPPHAQLQTSKLSIRDYFAAKLAAAGKLGSMTAAEFAGKSEPVVVKKEEPVSDAEEEEKAVVAPRGFTMDQQEDYYNRMMGCAISGGGVKTGQRARVGLGFGGAGLGANSSPAAMTMTSDGFRQSNSSLNQTKKSIKLEDEPMTAVSHVEAYTLENVEVDDEARRKAEKKAEKKRKKFDAAAAATAEEAKSIVVKEEKVDEDDEKDGKKQRKRAKKEAAAAAQAVVDAEAAAVLAEAERKEKKAQKKASKKKKNNVDSD